MNASEVAEERPALSAFGHLLKRLRVAANLTQQELAERAGVSERLISDYERGTIRRPRRDTVQLLSDGLHLSGSERDRFIHIARGHEIDALEITNDVSPILYNLPSPATRIVGRESYVDLVSEILLRPETRLLTLSGPGGVGKTRLAIEVAGKLKAHFPDGAYFVDLAPIREPELVLATIARVLGVSPSIQQPLGDRLAEAFHRRTLLLVLDNFEHLVAASPEIADLLMRCDLLTILATSRALLQIRVEHPVIVEPLELPDIEHLPTPAELAEVPAVELFLNRAMTAHGGLLLTDENARVVAEITVRLDGLPLAIELAATRLTVLTPEELLARLEQRLAVLTCGARDLPHRLQAMGAAIDWSYELLQCDERRLFRQLAVFSGGFSLDAAEQMAGGEPILDMLTSLVNSSLLYAHDEQGGTRRFQMLELIREYGLAQLSASGEEQDARSRHLTWCTGLVEAAQPVLLGHQQALWLARLAKEQNNIRLALTWAIEGEDAESAARICGACFEYWEIVSQFDEGRRWLERVTLMRGPISAKTKARVLLGQGVMAFKQGDYDRASVIDDALAYYQDQKDTAGIAYSLSYLGKVAMAKENHSRAIVLYEEALTIFRANGDDFWAGRMLHNMGLTAFDQGNYERASRLLEEALTMAYPICGPDAIASSLNNLALVALAREEFERATALQQEALHLWLTIGKKEGIAHSLENLALAAIPQQELVRAATLFGAAESVRVLIGAPGRLIDREFNEQRVNVLRDELGENGFARAWQTGSALSLDDAIALALEQSG